MHRAVEGAVLTGVGGSEGGWALDVTSGQTADAAAIRAFLYLPMCSSKRLPPPPPPGYHVFLTVILGVDFIQHSVPAPCPLPDSELITSQDSY